MTKERQNFDPSSLSGPLVVRSYGLSDRGRVRASNEDQFLIAELTKAMRVRQSSLPQPHTQYGDVRGHLLLVADGVGGEQGGEHASALAVGTIEEFALNTLQWFYRLEGAEEQSVLSEFQAALRLADERIFEEAEHHPELQGMGTTLTIAYGVHSTLFVIHVGDSRCYLMRDRALYRLTHDHTLVQEMVRAGHLAPEAAARHEFRHVITNVVGGKQHGLTAEVHKIEIAPGDVLLLCSDGLTEMVSDESISAILEHQTEPRAACERLVAEANQLGGRDNITVVTARFESAS